MQAVSVSTQRRHTICELVETFATNATERGATWHGSRFQLSTAIGVELRSCHVVALMMAGVLLEDKTITPAQYSLRPPCEWT